MFKSHSIKWTISLVKDSRKYNYRHNERKVFMMLRVIMVMVLLFPLTAFSQSTIYNLDSQGSLYRSTLGRSALGVNISFLENGKNLGGYLVSPIDHSLQVIFGVGIGLYDTGKFRDLGTSPDPFSYEELIEFSASSDRLKLRESSPSIRLLDHLELETLGGSIPPAPFAAVALEKTSAVGTTGLQSFLLGGVGASALKGVLGADNTPLFSIVDLIAFGGAGIFKRLKASSELAITPSFGVFYAYTWETVDDKIFNVKKNAEAGNFSGAAGMQLDLAPEFSIWSTLTFSFDTSDTILNVSVNWH